MKQSRRWLAVAMFGAGAAIVSAWGLEPAMYRRGVTQIRAGARVIEFPDGDHIRVGTVGPPRTGLRRKTIQIALRNPGNVPVLSDQLRLAEPCCTPARIEQNDRLEPGETGTLWLSVDLSVVRVGSNSIVIPLQFCSQENRVDLVFEYEVEPGEICGWTSPEVEFGGLCRQGQPAVRTVKLVVQPFEASRKAPRVNLTNPVNGLAVSMAAMTKGPGMQGQDANVYEIQIIANPGVLEESPGLAMLNVVGVDASPLPIQWRIVPEIERAPQGDLLVSDDPSQTHVLFITIRDNLRETPVIRDLKASRTGVGLSHQDTAVPHCQQVRIVIPAQQEELEPFEVQWKVLAGTREYSQKVTVRKFSHSRLEM